jgi:threonine/homoserine/homoserine lactone efflux protein
MIDLTTLLLFSAASILLAITPGPDMLYIATRSLSQGRSAGIVSALGVHTGVLVHTLAAAFGLSALIAASAMAFSVVKYAGAAYLVYLGIRTLLSRNDALELGVTKRGTLLDIYRQGVVTNVLNPKVILFFTAFLPQFVDPSRGSVMIQLLFLGVLLVIVTLPVDIAIGLLGGSVSSFFKRRKGAASVGKWVTGTVFIGLGIGTALTSRSKS